MLLRDGAAWWTVGTTYSMYVPEGPSPSSTQDKINSGILRTLPQRKGTV